jgi:hypothetical protein
MSLHRHLTDGEWEAVAIVFVIGVAWFCIKGIH